MCVSYWNFHNQIEPTITIDYYWLLPGWMVWLWLNVRRVIVLNKTDTHCQSVYMYWPLHIWRVQWKNTDYSCQLTVSCLVALNYLVLWALQSVALQWMMCLEKTNGQDQSSEVTTAFKDCNVIWKPTTGIKPWRPVYQWTGRPLDQSISEQVDQSISAQVAVLGQILKNWYLNRIPNTC